MSIELHLIRMRISDFELRYPVVLTKSQLWQKYIQNTTYIYLPRVVHIAIH
jgi:hypothetical protein